MLSTRRVAIPSLRPFLIWFGKSSQRARFLARVVLRSVERLLAQVTERAIEGRGVYGHENFHPLYVFEGVGVWKRIFHTRKLELGK